MDGKALLDLACRVAAAEASGNGAEARRLGREWFDALIEGFIDRHGVEAFEAELLGILAWAVEGAALCRLEGLTPPESLIRSEDN